jgi:hypothetical protein
MERLNYVVLYENVTMKHKILDHETPDQ